MPLKYSETGHITGCRAESVDDAKMCIKELKLRKKELMLQKKEVAAQIAQIRASHRSSKVASRAVKGKGFLASMVKTSSTIEALNVDGKVRTLEAQKTGIDQIIAKYDQAVLGLERYILDAAKQAHTPPRCPDNSRTSPINPNSKKPDLFTDRAFLLSA